MRARTTESLAERLLGYEAAAGNPAADDRTAAARVCEKLRQVLSTLLGAGGFRALIARALTLARAEAPELSAVQVNADGSLEGLGAARPQSGEGRIARGEIALIDQLLELLVTFIGEALMLRLVEDAWPLATLAESKSSKGKNL